MPLEPPADLDSAAHGVQACRVHEHAHLFSAAYEREARLLALKVLAPLDRERRASYALTLNCTDGRSFATARLTLAILDANDNVPHFRQRAYSVSVDEHFGPLQQVSSHTLLLHTLTFTFMHMCMITLRANIFLNKGQKFLHFFLQINYKTVY